uniref:Uncharacterized protein n=1 Tax=viral metagenome TaxID=1070528 RepID=A0A6C0JED4_9ZZZZ
MQQVLNGLMLVKLKDLKVIKEFKDLLVKQALLEI